MRILRARVSVAWLSGATESTQPPGAARLTSMKGQRWAVATAGLILAGVVAAACGADSPDLGLTATPTEDPAPTATAAPTEAPDPTATPAPTPTPTPFVLGPMNVTTAPVSPLNGMPLEEDTSSRRVLAVKIDNAAEARPQSGIQRADMMIEIWVEGITRFLSVWQDSDSDYVGPIRSMRPTDFALQQFLRSTFVNSGGQEFVQAIGNQSDVAWFQEPPGTFRIGSRFAPHNLYGDTNALRTLDGRGPYRLPLAPLWNFGPMPRRSGRAEGTILTSWLQGYTVSWTWNGEAYERSTLGAPHEYLDSRGRARRVTADTLIMLEMPIVSAGAGVGTPVPESVTVGEGTAWVFAGGRVQQGTWARETVEDWFVLTDAKGDPLAVPPGRLWLILPPPGGVTFD